MNIGNLGKTGGVDRPSDRSVRTDGKRTDAAPRNQSADQAAISVDGREAAAAFEARVAAAKADAADRALRVAEAFRKLTEGGLDQPEVHRAVAARLLGSDFLGA